MKLRAAVIILLVLVLVLLTALEAFLLTLHREPSIQQTAASMPGASIVILATGQSNFVRTNAYTWTPPTNLLEWNNAMGAGGIGSAFVPVQKLYDNVSNVPALFAADIAKANPTRTVYLINTSMSGQPIEDWLSSTSSPDMYDTVRQNITSALNQVPGSPPISILLWWEGEASANSTTSGEYAQNLGTVISGFQSERWFSPNTVQLFFGINSESNTPYHGLPGYDAITNQIKQFVAEDTVHRAFVMTGDLLFVPTTPGLTSGTGIHLSATGQADAAQRALTLYQNLIQPH